MNSKRRAVLQLKDNYVSKKTLRRLFGYIVSKNKLKFSIVIVGILLSSLGTVAISLSLKVLLDDYIVPLIGKTDPDFSAFYRSLIVLGCIFLVSLIASFVYNRLMVTIGQGVLKQVRDEMFEKLQTLPIRYFDNNTNGSIMSLFTNDTDALRQMINQSVPQVLLSGMTIIATFISMLILSPILTILAVIVVIVLLTVTRKIARHSGRFFMTQQKNVASLTGFIEERFSGQKVVKIFNHEEKSIEDFNKLNEELFESAKNASLYASIVAPIVSNIGNIFFVLTAIIGGVLSVNEIGGVTIGVLVAYMQFSKNFTQPFMQISQQLNSINLALAGASRIFELLDEGTEVDDGYVSLVNIVEEAGKIREVEEKTGLWAWKHPHVDGTLTYTKLSGDVRIENMSFGYTPEKPVLKNISLFAKPGQKIAFVGATGAGKTTITNLINRFYDIDEGKIRYDGINLSKIKKESLRRSLGIVLQDTHLFTDTIMENIRYGRLDATDEDVITAAKLAHADGFINMLPNGYNTVLTGAGDELSQGQKQLLSIARAAISNPPVLILDEATSSIDTRTEAIVQKGMDNLMKGRTVFVIAHRLSTIRNSDAIMVLDHGKIIERGSHDELIKLEGAYYQLYTGKVELE